MDALNFGRTDLPTHRVEPKFLVVSCTSGGVSILQFWTCVLRAVAQGWLP